MFAGLVAGSVELTLELIHQFQTHGISKASSSFWREKESRSYSWLATKSGFAFFISCPVLGSYSLVSEYYYSEDGRDYQTIKQVTTAIKISLTDHVRKFLHRHKYRLMNSNSAQIMCIYLLTHFFYSSFAWKARGFSARINFECIMWGCEKTQNGVECAGL